MLGGRVQGLGVRPAIFRLAAEFGLGGTVRNTARGVEIEMEGPAATWSSSSADFRDRCRRRVPDAVARGADRHRAAANSSQSYKEPTDGPLAARVPEDRAVCPDCSREIEQLDDRRHRYPFTSCTQCGPRYTVIRAMPFERDDTAMAEFPLCADCRQEYERPGDRRFHAQTTACPACGPRVWCSDVDGGRQAAR